MSRFASAPWPLKAATIVVLCAGAATLLGAAGAIIALAGLRRLSSTIDPAMIPHWFWYYRGDPNVRRWLGAGMLIAFGGAGLVVLARLSGRRPPLHGAARWASESELARAGLRARKGIVLGRKGGRLLVFGGPEHVVLYAPTRSGKGVGVVIPNLLTWPDSVVVLDVKRENWEASAGFRAAHGQQIILFDPLDAEGRTMRYNPLGHIRRGDPVEVLDELQKLAVMLFPAPNNSDPFWAEAARTGFIGVGAYVAQTPRLPFSLGAIFAELTGPEPKARLRSILTDRAQGDDRLSAGCAAALSDFCSASDNTFASIKQTITSRMNLWLNPRVCAATEVSDFDLRDLRSKRISLYLAVSLDNLRRVEPLYNLLLQQLVDLNTRERPSADRHAVEVLMVLDEFARIGHAGVIAHCFAFVAGYGLRLLPVLQSPAQLRAEYGPDLAEEIIANCGVEIAFAPKELKVAQDLSERLGFWTYLGRSTSRPTGLSAGRRSATESDQRRALMMPQELITMSANQLIILRAGMAPVRGRKIAYWRERAFAARVRPAPEIRPHAGFAGAQIKAATAAKQPAPAPAHGGDKDLRMRLPTLDMDVAPPRPLPRKGAGASQLEMFVDQHLEDPGRRGDRSGS